MKKVIKWLKKHPDMIYVAMFLALLAYHLFLNTRGGDDEYFSNRALYDNWYEVMKFRYDTWSSRTLVEIVLLVMMKLPGIVWCVLSSAALTSIAYNLSRLLTNHALKTRIISVLCVGLIPMALLKDAGWVTTTVNYGFPMAALLFALYPIKYMIDGKKMKWWQCVGAVIMTIFCCNQEQTCALMLGFLAVFLIYGIKKKLNYKFLIVLMIFALGGLAFIATTPGNAIRYEVQVHSDTIDAAWPYGEFDAFTKLAIGVNGMMSRLVVNKSVVFLLLTVILAVYSKELKKSWQKAVAWVPVLFCGIYVFNEQLVNFFYFPRAMMRYLHAFNWYPPVIWMGMIKYALMAMCVVVILAMLVSIYNVLKNRKLGGVGLVTPLILAAGFLSAVMIGFSPTYYASGERIFYFLYVVMAAVILVLCQKEEKLTLPMALLAIVFVAQMADNLILIGK